MLKPRNISIMLMATNNLILVGLRYNTLKLTFRTTFFFTKANLVVLKLIVLSEKKLSISENQS